MKILRTKVSHEVYYYLYYDLTMIRHNKKNSKKKKKLELGFSFQLFHFIAYSQPLSFDITSRDPSQV